MYLFYLYLLFDDIGLVVWDCYVIINIEDV